jgi:hypothetical protein
MIVAGGMKWFILYVTQAKIIKDVHVESTFSQIKIFLTVSYQSLHKSLSSLCIFITIPLSIIIFYSSFQKAVCLTFYKK